MAKKKLAKFADMDVYENVFQYGYAMLQKEPFPLKGKWSNYFGNDNPIVLELGCGKGEYTVGMAQRFPDRNYVGVDLQGARMWTGATEALEQGLKNVAFIRTDINLIAEFFALGEVEEIWFTFPDPQMKRPNQRLTSTRFMQKYQQVLMPGQPIHLKTDSNFMYTYTEAMVEANNLKVLANTDDLYASDLVDEVLEIKTFYEVQWLDRELTIKYLRFELPGEHQWVEPEVEIERDDYRSFKRTARNVIYLDDRPSGS